MWLRANGIELGVYCNCRSCNTPHAFHADYLELRCFIRFKNKLSRPVRPCLACEQPLRGNGVLSKFYWWDGSFFRREVRNVFSQWSKVHTLISGHWLAWCCMQEQAFKSPQFTLKASQKQGCHGQGKVRENRKFFKVRENSGNFLKSQGKSLILSKSVKSQGILFSGL